MTDAVLEHYEDCVRRATLNAPRIPFVSTLTGDWITDEQAVDPRHWVRQLREPVRFADALAPLLKAIDKILLEVGPGQTLSALVNRHPEKDARQLVLRSLPSSRDERADTAFLLGTLGRLWLGGVEVDWSRAHAFRQRRRTPLPTYPFERQRYWIEADGRSPELEGHEIAARLSNVTSERDVTAAAESMTASLTEDAAEPNISAPQAFVAAAGGADLDARRSVVTEQIIADIWREVFGIEDIGVNADFFELGGNSLIGIQLMSRIRKTFDTQLPMSKFFESPTIAGLTSMIEEDERHAHERDELEQLLKEIEEMSPEQLQATLTQELPIGNE
jgi:acyl transferase domain-containing protein